MIPFVAVMLAGGEGGPSGAPSQLSYYSVSDEYATRYVFTWVLGDAAAYTKLYVNGSVAATLYPGVTEYDGGYVVEGGPYTVYVRHFKNGRLSRPSNIVVA